MTGHPSSIASEAAARRASRAACLCAAALALLLYVATLCPTVYVAGTGENATAAATLGIPHPPGFPLYCLLGRLAVVGLPLPPATAMNLFAALAMAIAAGILAWLAARLTVSGLAGAAAGGLFAVALTPWSQAVIAEVYGLSAMLLALELALVLAWRGDLHLSLVTARRQRLFLLYAYVLGVGITVHPLHALLLPGHVLLVVTSARRREALRLALPAAGFMMLAATLHLYTPIRSSLDPRLDWGNPETWSGFVDYLTAEQYRGRMFSLAAGDVLANVARLGRILAAEWTLPALVLPLAGALMVGRRRPVLAAALGLMALADVVYAINYDIPWEIEVYYIPLVMVLALVAGLLVAVRPRITAPLVLAALVAAVWTHHGVAGRRGVDLVDRYGRDVLDALPRDAVLISPPTNPTFILLYLTSVEARRPDVSVYVAGKSGLAELGARPDARVATGVALRALARDPRRPLYYAVRDPLDDLPGYRLVPAGIVYRVAADAAADSLAATTWSPTRLVPEAVAADEDVHLRLIAARYFLARSDQAAASGDTAAAEADRRAALAVAGDRAEVYGELALRAAAEGKREAAIAAYRRALAIRDDDALVSNRLGRLLFDAGDVHGAEALFRRATELDPELSVAYSNLGALLGSGGDLPGAVEALRRAITLDPLSVKALNNLGTALLMSGDPAGAAESWRRSLALNPAQPQVARQLAAIERRP